MSDHSVRPFFGFHKFAHGFSGFPKSRFAFCVFQRPFPLMSEFQPTTVAADAAAWRNWLAHHHATHDHVWLILFKKASTTNSVTYDEAVDEALCYGWVDSVPKKRDADSYYQYFSRRNPTSNWSRVNKEKIARLDAAGKLAPAGRKMVETARASGTWDALNDVENLVVPDDLAAAFDARAGSRAHWETFPRSVRRGILEWIFNAKRPTTRNKRIGETAERAARNERANQWR